MSDTQKEKLAQRDQALAKSMFYNSENPYLRGVAIQNYEQEQDSKAQNGLR